MPAPVRLRPGLNISFQAQHVTGLMDYLTEQTHSTVSARTAPQAWLDKTIHPQIKIFTIILKRNLEKWNSQSEAPALICMFYQTCRAHFQHKWPADFNIISLFFVLLPSTQPQLTIQGNKIVDLLLKTKNWIRK